MTDPVTSDRRGLLNDEAVFSHVEYLGYRVMLCLI